MDGELIGQDDHWCTVQGKTSIAWKEVYAIAIAINTWGTLWQRRKVIIHCDNQTVVNVWENETCKSPKVKALVCMLTITSLFVSSTFLASGIIIIADALSHFQHHCFRRITPNDK